MKIVFECGKMKDGNLVKSKKNHSWRLKKGEKIMKKSSKRNIKRYITEVIKDLLLYTVMIVVIVGLGLVLSGGGYIEEEPVEQVHVKIAEEPAEEKTVYVRKLTAQEETVKLLKAAQVKSKKITLVSAAPEQPEYNETDLELLAQLMYAEEGVLLAKYDKEPEKVERVFKLAGSVVIRRMENNYLGATTLKEVVYTKGQYALQTLEKVSQGQDVPSIVYVWAKELLTEGPIGPKGLIFQAEFEQGEVYDRIYNQVFGVETKYN